MDSIKVFSPATLSNLGPGFDLLGLAINGLGDTIIAEKINSKKIEFISDPNFPELPIDNKNVAYHVANCVREAYQTEQGIRISLQKNIPLSSGLGGSGASSAASVVAVNELLGGKFSKKELLKFALEGERVAAGSAHGDNVAPALFGGLCLLLVDKNKLIDVVQLPIIDKFYWVILHPHCQLETKKMRELLPSNISLTEHTAQASNLSLLISGLLTGNFEWIKFGLQDNLIEPKRAAFIPGFSQMKSAALNSGAIGFAVSGSGPTVFALSDQQQSAESIGVAMQQVLQKTAKLTSDLTISKTNFSGTVIDA